MAESFLLEIVTPEKLFFTGRAQIVIVRTLTGEEGFMAGHSWACKLLGTGELWFQPASGNKEFRVAAVSGGFIDVKDKILVFSDSAEWPGDIDVERAEAAVRREEEWLSAHGTGIRPESEAEEIEIHRKSLRRAKNRVNVAGGGVRPRK